MPEKNTLQTTAGNVNYGRHPRSAKNSGKADRRCRY